MGGSRRASGPGDAASLGDATGAGASYGAVDDAIAGAAAGQQGSAASAEKAGAAKVAKQAMQAFQTAQSSLRVSTRDLPALLLPWVLYVVCFVPIALMRETLLSYFALVLCATLGVGFLLLSNGRAWKFLALVCLLASAVGYTLGRYDRGRYLYPYLMYSRSPYHTNVLPSDPPLPYRDVGYVEFSTDAHIDTSRSLGYRSGSLWCVAPIVGRDHSSLLSLTADRIGFWAVGQDCCRTRGYFACGEVTNSMVHGGLAVMRTGDLSDPLVPSYLEAARAAAATYGIILPEDPVFVEWSQRPRDALEGMFANAQNFAALAIFACLAIVPLFSGILNCFELGLTNREDGPHWHREELSIMTFGMEFTPRSYEFAVKEGLLHQRCYWSGEVLYDYAFQLANKHMFLSCLMAHPANPCSKVERLIVCVLVSLLIVFPVAAWSHGHGTGFWRTVLILFLITTPRNLLRLGLMHINVQKEITELSQGFEQGPAAKQALSREVSMFTAALILIAIVCLGCGLYITKVTDQPLSVALLEGVGALGFAAILEPLMDLVMPFIVKRGQGEELWVFGFFGRWRLERDTYPNFPSLYQAGEEIFLGQELEQERAMIRQSSLDTISMSTRNSPTKQPAADSQI